MTDEEIVAMHASGELRLRRWQQLHFEDFADTILDVVPIDHPDYNANIFWSREIRFYCYSSKSNNLFP
ncbi:MAG: hypothetical protein AB4426_28765 [Xenococcaceae cyanobacterium]